MQEKKSAPRNCIKKAEEKEERDNREAARGGLSISGQPN
jgi:hypothetical protein